MTDEQTIEETDIGEVPFEATEPQATEPQATRYAVDAAGNYIGAFVGLDIPEGSIEVPFPPEDARQKWLGEAWGTIPADVPEVISDRQFFQALAKSPYLLISETEALAAVKTGEIPAAMQVILDQVPPESKFDAEMLLSGATEFKRSNPLVATFAAALGWTDTQTDQFWIFAHSL